MSLIEEASKRLEELKRTGVQVPDGLSDAAQSPRGESTQAPSENTFLTGTPELAVTPGEVPELRVTSQPAKPVDQARPRRVSRTVAIDLARLAAEGFVTPDMPQSPIAQEFRVIKRPLITNVQGKSGVPPNRANLLMVTSALAGEGKSFCALNLAMSIAAELDSRVLLVDADVANPSLMAKLRLPESRGLLDVLTDPGLGLSDVILRTNVERLSLLPAGNRQQSATELLASEGMSRLVAEMSARYPDRIVVFDSPPLLLTTEAPTLASHMGQIVMVVEAERTSVTTAKHALATIDKCPIVMTVLNKASAHGLGSYEGYGYGSARRAAR